MQREKKMEIITLRVTPRTKERIRAKAQELDPILSDLKAQGRNLNQLTTLANMGKVTVVYSDKLVESYQQISEQFHQLLREAT